MKEFTRAHTYIYPCFTIPSGSVGNCYRYIFKRPFGGKNYPSIPSPLEIGVLIKNIRFLMNKVLFPLNIRFTEDLSLFKNRTENIFDLTSDIRDFKRFRYVYENIYVINPVNI